MFNLEYRDFGWWYWLASVLLLTAGVLGWTAGFCFAILLTVIQLIHFMILEKNAKSLAVQVRAGFLIFLILFYWKPLRFLYWWPVIGLWARVLFSYCCLARILTLLPWNRKEPMSLDLLKRTFLTPPVCGSVLDNRPQNKI